jgi:putative hemolysin
MMWRFGSAFDSAPDPGAELINPSGLKTPRRIVRDLCGLPPVLGETGPFEIRLATTNREIRKAQRLRFKVFYEEGGAIPARAAALMRRDFCPFDEYCDHLLVIDRKALNAVGRQKPKVVGTYRLLRCDVAEAHAGFYSQNEFDIIPLLARHAGKRFLELGRSCVHANYRSKRVIELLWRGLWIYAQHHRIDVLMGCASLPGTNPLALALPLSFLHHHAAAAEEWHVAPLAGRGVPMAMIDEPMLDRRKGLAALPPLVKAYLRVGARFGDGAVVDPQFGTTDVFTVMPVADIEERYIAHYGGADLRESFAA